MKICPKLLLGALSGCSGGHLGAKRHHDSSKDVPEKIKKSYLAPSWPENPAQMDEIPIKTVIKKSMDF